MMKILHNPIKPMQTCRKAHVLTNKAIFKTRFARFYQPTLTPFFGKLTAIIVIKDKYLIRTCLLKYNLGLPYLEAVSEASGRDSVPMMARSESCVI